jgi:hypothetical protein
MNTKRHIHRLLFKRENAPAYMPFQMCMQPVLDQKEKEKVHGSRSQPAMSA